MNDNSPRQPNTLGKASLILGVIGSAFVFSVCLCAGVGQQQGWLRHVAPLLFIVGGSFAFLGALGVLLGFAGLFGRNRSRAVAIVGFILGVITVAMFLAANNAVK